MSEELHKRECSHHSRTGWALVKVYAPDGTLYKQCRRCGRVFFDSWPLEEAFTSEKPVADHHWRPTQTIEGIVCGYCKGAESSPRHYT